MKIYLVRHTSVNVPAGFAYGQTDVEVKCTFPEEARRVKEQIEGIKFEQVWCSPLTRCRKLATYCGYPEATTDKRIMEINFGEWEMKSWDDISTDPRSTAWFDDWVHTSIPQGESLQGQYNRVKEFLDSLRNTEYEKVCLFTHGGVIACMRVYLGEINLKDALNKVPPYGTVLSFEI